MTNVFNDLLDKVENGGKTGDNNSTSRNILLKGVRYENGDTLVGLDMRTNEEIKVQLRDAGVKNENSKFSRISIEEMSDSKNRKRYADATTSEFLIESAYIGDDGIYKSRWIRVLKKLGVQSTNLQRFINYSYYKNKDGKDVVIAKMLSPKPTMVKTEEDFISVLGGFLHPKTIASKTLAYINIMQEDESGTRQNIVMEVRPKQVDREDGYGKKCDDGVASVNEFLEKNPEVKNLLISEDYNSGKIKIAAFKAFVIFPGGDTRDAIVDSTEKSKEFIFNQFKVTDENGKVRQGFKECIISIRNHKDDISQFFTSIDIVSHQDVAKTIDQF